MLPIHIFPNKLERKGYIMDHQNDFNLFDDDNTSDIPKPPKRKKVSAPEERRATVRQGEKISDTGKSKRRKKKSFEKKGALSRAISDPDSTLNISLTYVFIFVAIYFAFCLYGRSTGAIAGHFMRFILFGLFSSAAYTIPPFLLLQGITWRHDVRQKTLLRKVISTFVALLFISALIYLPKGILQGKAFNSAGEFFSLFFSWQDPLFAKVGGGLLGSSLGWALFNVFGKVGTVLIFALVILLYFIFFFNFNPKTFAKKSLSSVKASMQKQKGKRDAKKSVEKKTQEKEIEDYPAIEPEEREDTPLLEGEEKPRIHAKRIKRRENPVGANTEEKHEKFKNTFTEYGVFDDDEENEESSEEIANKKLRSREGVSTASVEELEFGRFSMGEEENPSEYKKSQVPLIDDDDETIARQSLSDIRKITKRESTPDKEKIPVKNVENTRTRRNSADTLNGTQEEKNSPSSERATPKYVFPPLSLLERSPAIQDSLLNAESDPVAIKLRQTLRNFNVNTTISDISRGPRITRYELVPDTGIRIRAIANLVDDISMALATAGIRIEAPIPGKAAVGIEVPNASPTTVRLRSLLDAPGFKEASAKTTVCLGADIAGDAVYADLARMPHMLIAGATGMGKSVCINTIITSILYKARPDEVKLILVDPKKVELNVYSGIPHLLIPVVSDPNQAAGALAWAVNEMESRFDKIEAEGVRNIKGYNKAIEGDPSKEPMCQIIIVIDELADLMMSSPDSVETSICRIAQKARAAGIHLIIGTQRPSVNVITGLIKANIPSRIAFHVASQIDSRTILDSAGAEKLLNNGDMLFFPVGIPKPRRIQGAFIDDDEVERVTTFLKKNSKGVSYDEEIIQEINKAAEKCAQSGKRKGGSDGDDGGSIDGILDDPKFNEAVEVAFDANKISTSLLQRKLSIGFGRASKYIDAMCDMGIVSEPDGQKPRDVLMTRNEYYDRKNRLSE